MVVCSGVVGRSFRADFVTKLYGFVINVIYGGCPIKITLSTEFGVSSQMSVGEAFNELFN